MALILPHKIESGTVADATEVDGNDQFAAEFINTSVLMLDGSQTMQGPLTLKGPPTQPLHAASKTYVDNLIPIGTILPYGGLNAPAGDIWLPCDGSTRAIADFPDLHGVLLARYGTAVAGSFKLPDLRGRVMIGQKATETRFASSGLTGGTWIVPVPQHHHAMTHDHGEFDSGNQSANHTHSIAHNHGSFNTKVAGEHQHTSEYTSYEQMNPGTGPYFARRIVDAGAIATSTVAGTGDHAHAIDVPQFTGNSGSQSASHSHKVNVPKFTGDTANTGTANAEHLPPFQVIFFIIKAK